MACGCKGKRKAAVAKAQSVETAKATVKSVKAKTKLTSIDKRR